MTTAVAAFVALFQKFPVAVRRRIYEVLGVLSALAGVVVLALPHADAYGVHVPAQWVAVFPLVAAFLSALARSNSPVLPVTADTEDEGEQDVDTAPVAEAATDDTTFGVEVDDDEVAAEQAAADANAARPTLSNSPANADVQDSKAPADAATT